MTLEEELALLRQNGPKPPDALSGPAAGPVVIPVTTPADMPPTPTPAPADAAPEQVAPPALPDGVPPPETGLPELPKTDAGTWEVMGAGWQAETIKTDAYNYAGKKRENLAWDIFDRLPQEAQNRVLARRFDPRLNGGQFEEIVLGEATHAAIADPSAWGGLPASREAFDAQIDKARRDELEAAQDILDQPGGGISEFLGSSARAMTDEVSLLMLPLGVQGGFVRTILAEMALGGLGEAAIIPREKVVARELDLPEPDPWSRITTGALLGGGFSAGILGIVKGLGFMHARTAGIKAVTPKGGDHLATEIGIDKAEAQLRDEPTVQESLKARAEAGTTTPLPGADQLDYNEAATLRAIIGTESGGKTNAANPNSSAYGLGQFIGSTWMAMVRKYRPDLMDGRSNSEILSLRGDPTISAEMTAMYTRENAAVLRANGLPSDPGSLYLGHFMGPGGMIKALTAPLDTPIARLMSPREIAANKGIRFGGKSFADFTAGDLRRWSAHKMRSAYDPNASRDMPVYSGGTSRGYTGSGQVTAGENITIDVRYEVVDASTLTRASGDLQPRDRSRINSDAWISDTAARLDPAQLMPAPTADRGAPIVGPDNMIESGNGRYGAILRAYELHPDRADAYRSAIEAAGYAIPEGISRPVLVARRTTELTPPARRDLVIAAQDSGVAVMTPSETARASARSLSAPVLGLLDASQPIGAEANGGFVRAALQTLPRSARNAMFDKDGLLNSFGRKQMREAIFARAWDAPDLIEMFTEGDAGELKSLMEALGLSAPNWASLKADIEAGLVRPEMDISGHVLDAMRLIAAARKLATAEKMPIAKAVENLLDDVDLLSGAVSPLTTALVKKFWRNGRAAPAEEVAGFLSRYADEARIAGKQGGMFDAPGPREVLQTIDREAFADLPEDLGLARVTARPEDGSTALRVEPPQQGFDAGAASPEAEAVDKAALDALEQPLSDDPGLTRSIDPEADLASADLADARAEFADDLDSLEIDLGDGTTASFRAMLDDLDADAEMSAAIRACAITPGGA